MPISLQLIGVNLVFPVLSDLPLSESIILQMFDIHTHTGRGGLLHNFVLPTLFLVSLCNLLHDRYCSRQLLTFIYECQNLLLP